MYKNLFSSSFKGLSTITFVTLNGFCPLSKKSPTPLFPADNIKMNRILTKIFSIVFRVLKVLLIKNCKMQLLDLSLHEKCRNSGPYFPVFGLNTERYWPEIKYEPEISPYLDTFHTGFHFLLFLLAFTSADIIFHKFSELHSTLSEKKIFITNVSFLPDSLNPPPSNHHSLNSQNIFCSRCENTLSN